MIEDYVLSISKEAILLVIILSAPAVVASLIVGLSVSLFQATTQIQDQTLTFVPKLVAVMLVLILTGTWTMRKVVDFAYALLGEFNTFIK